MFNKISSLIFFILLSQVNILSANQLGDETSPYLLQHKNNPVDWYPWGDEAFAKAKGENKLIFLSIGYSTCHWCHVMAHESFEDKSVAKALNKDFISIKVDKEQFPHIDNYYQNVYRTMNKKSGGWPLTIIMTADKKPFFSGTYIPKEEGYGSKGLVNILDIITNYDKKDLQESADNILKIVTHNENIMDNEVKLDKKLDLIAVEQYKSYYDFKYKGFSQAPKFPQASNIITLLKIYEATKNEEALTMATDALTAMAKGGIYDQIEGGFYRYSVDKRWEIPHFEKMLYTNAELLVAYSNAYKITKNKLYKKIINETIAQIDKRFKTKGVYQSASNADSENFEGHNEEGFYFVYEYFETEEFLEKNRIDQKTIKNTLKYLGITEDGNFDGDFSNPNIIDKKEPKNLEVVKKLLIQLRKKKEYPFIDNKINTAWNSLYIKGKFKAGYINPKYIKEARYSLDRLIELLYVKGELYHQTIIGVKPTQKALLEDYAFLSSALFEAYQKTLDKKYFILFEELVNKSIEKFYKNNRWTESDDGFVTYAKIDDNGYASALAVTINNIILYATVEADFKIRNIALKTISLFSNKINQYPAYYPNTLQAVMMSQYEPVFIKSKKKKLKALNLEDINHPFVYKYVYESEDYLACKLSSCFSYGKDFEKIKKDIEELLK